MVHWETIVFFQLGFYLFNLCIILSENYEGNLILCSQESERIMKFEIARSQTILRSQLLNFKNPKALFWYM